MAIGYLKILPLPTMKCYLPLCNYTPPDVSPLIKIIREFDEHEWYRLDYMPRWGQHPEFEHRMNCVFDTHIHNLLSYPTCVDSYTGRPSKCNCISKCTEADLLWNLQFYIYNNVTFRRQHLTLFARLDRFTPDDPEGPRHQIDAQIRPGDYDEPTYKGPKIPDYRIICTNTFRNLFGITLSEWPYLQFLSGLQDYKSDLNWVLRHIYPPAGIHRLPVCNKKSAKHACRQYINYLIYIRTDHLDTTTSLRKKYANYCEDMGVEMLADRKGNFRRLDPNNQTPVASWSSFRRNWIKQLQDFVQLASDPTL